MTRIPYDTAPDLADQFATEAAARRASAARWFLVLCCWSAAELAIAVTFRGSFALAPYLAAACFAVCARRLWRVL